MTENGKKTKKRSPNYPYISLRDAIDKARILYQKDGQSGTTKDAAFEHWGYSGPHGVSLGVLSALKKFGLTYEENDRIMLTDDAVIILMEGGEQESTDVLIGLCALKPELYAKLWNEFKDKGGLPSDATLKSILVRDYQFNSKTVDTAIKAMRDTFEFAGIRPYDPRIDSQKEEESKKQSGGIWEQTAGKIGMQSPKTDTATVPLMRDYLIPRKDDKVAILRIEKPITKEDVDQISKWLELMKSVLTD